MSGQSPTSLDFWPTPLPVFFLSKGTTEAEQGFGSWRRWGWETYRVDLLGPNVGGWGREAQLHPPRFVTIQRVSSTLKDLFLSF